MKNFQRKKLLVVAAILGCFFCLAPATPLLADTWTWTLYDGHYYALTNYANNWGNAEIEAEAAGGHLVTVNDASELAFLINASGPFYNVQPPGYTVPGTAFFWIGLYNPLVDKSDLANWVWASDDTSTFWQSIRYSTFPQGGSYAYLHTTPHPAAGTINADPTWNDNRAFGVIERDGVSSVPEPATLFLLGAGLFCVFGLMRKRGMS